MSTPGTLEHATEQRDAARAYRGKDGMGAMIGECDWEAEMSIIREEKATSYAAFLARKKNAHVPSGFSVSDADINPACFPFQRHIIRRAAKAGRHAIFADCGTGKTLMQGEWARLVHEHTGGDVLVLAPLAVSKQSHGEFSKFGIASTVCRSQADVKPGINITNYEKLHHFDLRSFVGVVLDESSILKSYNGATRTAIIEATRNTPYRLACTATPSPNDYMELGNHSEFLGVMNRTGMLATYFNHDGGETSKWRLKGHAVKPYWAFVSSWATMCSKPSDLGFSDVGYSIPEIHRKYHVVETNAQDGLLFACDADSLSERRESRRISIDDRVSMLAEMASQTADQWLVWGDLNAETDAAEDAISDSVQVAGADSDEDKESRMLGFARGEHRVLVTKPKIGGFGMNWQNCHMMAFLGLSDSWESTYQAERRCWRYGQQYPVEVHTFVTDRDGAVLRNIARKRAQAQEMTQHMIEAIKETL